MIVGFILTLLSKDDKLTLVKTKGDVFMRLTLEDIKSVAVGAVKITENSDGHFNFFKCTDRQIEAWYEFGDQTLGDRAKTTTGIRLDFHTNSKSFAFRGTGRKLEVLIDGMQRGLYFPNNGEDFIEAKLDLTDSVGNHKDDIRVTLVFSSHGISELYYAELDDGAYVKRHEFSVKMLFIGDSITQGWNSHYDTLSFAWRVTNHYDAESVINGIGGAFYEPKTFDKPDFDPDIVIIAYGTNDAMRFKVFENMEQRVKGYLDLVKEAYGDKRVIVISPIWRAGAEMKPMGAEFDKKRKMVEREAVARGFEVISGLDLVPPRPEFFADTYLHPNDLGFGVYAENLIKFIDKKH